MKKITGFKQKEDQIDGCLDRANELNTFFNRFSSETTSASSSPAHSITDIPPSFDPWPSCNTSNVLSSTSAMDPSASTCLPSTKSEDADAPFAFPFHLCVSRRERKERRKTCGHCSTLNSLRHQCCTLYNGSLKKPEQYELQQHLISLWD
ncbi:hypothetical protein AMECASPLE_015743 [Ameca splendens]|uniref:Uncharacterized protein n=1 Tax=Ameca splendens TaxID=208324 RepID=A0ABV0Z0R6_9TELE